MEVALEAQVLVTRRPLEPTFIEAARCILNLIFRTDKSSVRACNYYFIEDLISQDRTYMLRRIVYNNIDIQHRKDSVHTLLCCLTGRACSWLLVLRVWSHDAISGPRPTCSVDPILHISDRLSQSLRSNWAGAGQSRYLPRTHRRGIVVRSLPC